MRNGCVTLSKLKSKYYPANRKCSMKLIFYQCSFLQSLTTFPNKFVRRISTIKGELIPYLVKKQFSVTSKDIKKCNDFEVEDTPNPKSNIQNGEPGRKSKYQTNIKFNNNEDRNILFKINK